MRAGIKSDTNHNGQKWKETGMDRTVQLSEKSEDGLKKGHTGQRYLVLPIYIKNGEGHRYPWSY